jgi:sortase A
MPDIPATSDRLSLARPGSPAASGAGAAPAAPVDPPQSFPGGVPRPHRALRALSWVLILAGVLALADAAVTLLWQEPLSALYARIEQDRLSGALRQVERAQPTPVERRRLALLPARRQRIAFLAGELQHHAAYGGAVGAIHIPSIGADFVIVKGTGVSELQKGPGVFPETRFPGIAGTTAIAGHRTTYLAPFRHIDALRAGNRIVLDMPYAHFTYTVTGHRVVSPSDVGAAVNPVGYSRLVLSACTPLFSAAQRLLVFARLTRTVPVGAARIVPQSISSRTAAPLGGAAAAPSAAPFLTSGARNPPDGAPGRPVAAAPPAASATSAPAPAPPT